MPKNDKLSAISIIGIPRGLLYYRYGVLWTTFFEVLGFEVVVSDPTDKAIAERGERLSVDECCLASKVYMGHVASLANRCDGVFVPCYASKDHRCSFCTKFQSAPDMVKNAFRETGVQVITCMVENVRKPKEVRRSFEDMALRLGATRKDADRAWKSAASAQSAREAAHADSQARKVKALSDARRATRRAANGTGGASAAGAGDTLAILVVAHPYIAYDSYLSGAVVDTLDDMGATVLFADAVDRDKAYKKSFEFSETMPWVVNRELIGSILLLDDVVDGIVLISAFPCGPDSMTNDAVMRCIQGTPILNLMIDAQSGTAGVETRIESFVDILRFQQRGGYVHG